jgi:hypothetical protein
LPSGIKVVNIKMREFHIFTERVKDRGRDKEIHYHNERKEKGK